MNFLAFLGNKKTSNPDVSEKNQSIQKRIAWVMTELMGMYFVDPEAFKSSKEFIQESKER